MAKAVVVVVVIDGPAGAGKSTVAKKLAVRLGYAFLDTGAIYRAVALAARERGLDWGHGSAVGRVAQKLDLVFAPQGEVLLEGRDVTKEIRMPEISEGASRVSAHPEVRAALLDLQRRLGARGGVVAEGRDLGTVVFPQAEAKFFLTAGPEERARRRARELGTDPETVLAEMKVRDARDSSRAVAPLRKAEDAIEVDSEGLTADEVVDRMAALVRARGG